MGDWFAEHCTWPEATRYEYTQWALGNVDHVVRETDTEDEFLAYLDAVFA